MTAPCGKMINFGSVTAGADQVRLIAQAMTKAGTTEYKFQPTTGAAS